MSYYTAKKSYEQQTQDKQEYPRYVCSVCLMEAIYADLTTYGARCGKCYQNYCRSAPRYEPQPAFNGDAKDWARRIIYKKENGLPVSKIAEQFAKDALGIK